MLSKFKLSAITGMAVAVVGFAGIASAQEAPVQPKDDQVKEKGFGKHRGGKIEGRGGMRGMRGMHRGMGFHGLRGIELTEAQKAQIKAIHDANKPSEAQMAEMKAKREAFREARKAGTALTEEQKTQMKAERSARKAKMEQVHAQILAILTPEQKAQLDAKQAERKQRMEQRREMRKQRKTDGDAAKPNGN